MDRKTRHSKRYSKLSGVVLAAGLGVVVGVVGPAGAVPAGEQERGGEPDVPGAGRRVADLVGERSSLGPSASWLAEHQAEVAWVCWLGGRLDLRQFWAELLAQRGLEMPRIEFGDYGPEVKVADLNTGPWAETLSDPVGVGPNGSAGGLLYEARPWVSWEGAPTDKSGGPVIGKTGFSFVD